jgi:hypothetical protein
MGRISFHAWQGRIMPQTRHGSDRGELSLLAPKQPCNYGFGSSTD